MFVKYKLLVDGSKLRIEFSKKSDITSFIRWDFYSKILHSLKPGSDGVWEGKDRLPVHIRGWPKIVNWHRVDELIMESSTLQSNWILRNFRSFSNDLQYGIENAIDKIEQNGVKFSVFQIGNKTKGWTEYRFQSASREVVALCILYDLQPHPRNHLELWLHPDNYPPISNKPHSNWPRDIQKNKRYFGDPSKAVESLEKMGWPRHGADATSEVSRDIFQGSRQEIYQITQIEQQIKHMRIRKDIPRNWRIAILKRDDFTCLYCGRKYSEKDMNEKTGKHPQLDPDHRIPVNVKSDDSNDSNFLENLMTLCSTCNQRKREITKKFQANDGHDWENEEWAYPDRIDFLKNRILKMVQIYAEKEDCSVNEVLSKLESTENQ